MLAVVRALLRDHPCSQRQLAREMGVSRPYIDRRLSGDLPLSLDDLARLAPILGVEVHAVLAATASMLAQCQKNRLQQEDTHARHDR